MEIGKKQDGQAKVGSIGVRVAREVGKRERKKGEGKDWRELGGVGRWRRRKGGYRSREEDTYSKGSILELTRDLALEGIPDVHRMSPARSLNSRGEGA